MDYQNYHFYQQPKKKKMGFGPGFGFGVLTGGILAAAVMIAVVIGYTRMTGDNIVLGGRGVTSVSHTDILDDETAAKIDELTYYMDIYYYEDYEKQDVRNALYEGLVSGLGDPYSTYYSKEEYEDLQVTTSGTYYGIGAGLSQDVNTMQVTITKVYEGTPSEEAGLKKDDVVLYVEDVDATSMEVTELVKLIRGEEGTTVHLQIYRPSTGETMEFDVERRNVELPSVTGEMLDNAIGYIQISEFQSNTAEQFETILADLESQNMNGLIVDVRSNPGGLVTSVVRILDDLLPKGTVVYMEDKYGSRQDYTSDDSCVDYPIVVLMDENSASASEIFAGAIKDFDYGTLVGTTTFGKGIVQTIYPLKDGDAIKITTAKYFTPSGVNIHGSGIDPDVEIEYEYTGPEDGEYEKQYDNQLQKAIEVMNGQLGH